MRPIFALIPALAAGAVLLAAPGKVDGQVPRAEPQYGSYELEVVVGGAPRAEYEVGGQTWVEGRLGERYTLRIANHDPRRVEVVLSVDGRDAIDGQPSQPSKRGYVLPPWGSAEIDGFRLSQHEVAAFRFTTVADSYASRMGTAWNVGRITASFYPERVVPRPRPRPLPPVARRGAPAGESRSDTPDDRGQGLGTEFGERRWSPVHETNFVRANSWPSASISIRYNDRRGLCAAGLYQLCERRARPQPPSYDPYDPYEPYEPYRRYATPPPGWPEN
jgi:hypothetical protein